MYCKPVVAYDGSPEARKALLAGIAIAKQCGVDLCAVTVEEEMPAYLVNANIYGSVVAPATLGEIDTQRRAFYADMMEEARAIAHDEGVRLETNLVIGDEVWSIVEAARRCGADLLLVGFHKHSRLADRLLGSTAHGVCLDASCSVLVVK